MLTKRFTSVGIVFCLSIFIYCIFFPSLSQIQLKLPLSASKPHEPINWKARKQNYPVSSVIPLPTGSPKKIPLIQHQFPSEPAAARAQEITQRRDAVKHSFERAWKGYKKHAWLKDELLPVSGGSRDTFGGWAATLVDSLDTLLIMNLTAEFEHAVMAVARIDFGYTDDVEINVFETTIRYMGGLLAAYDLSVGKDAVLLTKATELGEFLLAAFDTRVRMPVTRWPWRGALGDSDQGKTFGVLVAEIGSLSLEFTRLSQLTGDPRFFDAVQRIADRFEEAQPLSKLPGMWPIVVNSARPDFGDDSSFSLGAMADSVYEYLPKQYMLLGGLSEQPKKMYETAIEVAKKHLFFRPMVPKEADILFSGNVKVYPDSVINDGQGQHLACFVGGMVGIASKIFDRPDDLVTARKLVDGCIWAYESMRSGIMPEVFQTVVCGNTTSCPYDEKNADISPFYPGFAGIDDTRYILRPEAIESIFILYRITGDEALRDHAWTIFQAIEKATATEFGNSAIDDVTTDEPPKSDNMESFWTAETLKYFYLIFSEPELVSLDEFVFNTEAHPFRRPV